MDRKFGLETGLFRVEFRIVIQVSQWEADVRQERTGLALLAAAALLAACGGDAAAPVAGLSAEEAAQLNNAAEMLDAQAGIGNTTE
ncbi:hypothetical protein [Sphingomonas jatrophae]|uniref:Uncharacterized protein n=1 Tax=Sphingomonas jatrophae TaxID=1166337 RepID=A0A1I6LCE4_9SPHN|nr:hypothetical protein [Sphingomonas jatrophae]SFS01145.1 hypothetical protein SAMN05192580_2571 [Sphingomonas jatrophae]